MTPTAATWGVVLLLAFISGLTTLVGVALGLRLGQSTRAVAVGIGFSAGVMVLVSLRELLPAAFAAVPSPRVWGAVALGAGLLAVLHVVIPHIHLVEEPGRIRPPEHDLRFGRGREEHVGADGPNEVARGAPAEGGEGARRREIERDDAVACPRQLHGAHRGAGERPAEE